MAPSEPSKIDVNENIHTDFEKAFQDGCQCQYYVNDRGLQTIKFATYQIDKLVLLSGRLVACDPLLEPDPNSAFIRSIQAGSYPVVLSLADLSFRPERRIACAMLQLTLQTPIRYELAILAPDQPSEYQNYGVDSGTGSFMDAEVARALKQLSEPNSGEAAAVAVDRFKSEYVYCESVINAMQRNRAAAISNEYPYDRKGDWANICIDENTGANVIAFGTGWGDGGYASYWGYDADGNIACLVTDFALFGSDDEDDEE
ncbi:MAG: DUF4241 domain-containing protein [Leptolyngbyaceae cyanobacterium]